MWVRTVIVLGVLGLAAGVVSAWENVGEVTDAVDMELNDYLDIVSARVEKQDAELKFVITARGTIPLPGSLPSPDGAIVYLWLVDADNNITTGQVPWQAGSDFNIRAVVSQSGAEAFVDTYNPPGVTGGTAAINGNEMTVTIDRAVIGSVHRLHWRSSSFQDLSGFFANGNLPTTRTLARPAKYGVLMDWRNAWYYIGDNIMYAESGDMVGIPVIDQYDWQDNNFPVKSLRDGAWPDVATGTIVGSMLSHAGPMQLRNVARMQLYWAPVASWGYTQNHSRCDFSFILDGPSGQTGPVPTGMFWLTLHHDAALYVQNANPSCWAQTNAYVSVNDGFSGSWNTANTFYIFEDWEFPRFEKRIDLADWGLEFGTSYFLSMELMDYVSLNDSTQPDDALALSDSAFTLDIDAGNPPGDANSDREVNLLDLALMAEYWLAAW